MLHRSAAGRWSPHNTVSGLTLQTDSRAVIGCPQEKMEEQLRPLFAALEEIQGRLAKGGSIPNFGSLKDWALVSTLCCLPSAPKPWPRDLGPN